MTHARIVGALMLVLTLAARPGFAQVSLGGDWGPRMHEDQPDRGPGPELGDYTGLPITDGARLAADSWDASRLTLREHQCKVHIAPYILHGPLQVRIWEEKDPQTQQLSAIRIYISTYEQNRTIWMDGRPHPPEYAPHTWQGFSTGKWEGDILTVYTTHIKQEWIRRNGVPNSEKSTMIEHFIRHGNILTHLETVDRSRVSHRAAAGAAKSSCSTSAPSATGCGRASTSTRSSIGRTAPCRITCPGKSPFDGEFARTHGIPIEAAKGGAETTYPEYQAKLRALIAAGKGGVK